MKKKIFFSIIWLVLCFSAFSQEKPIKLIDIIKSIDSYQGKEMELVLRLRSSSEKFSQIVFYDENNHDIVFELNEEDRKKKFKKMLFNHHEGAFYKVNFVINGLDYKKRVNGNLKSFKLMFLEKLP